jgi:hypothetical protein
MSEKLIQVDAFTGEIVERDLTEQEIADLETLRSTSTTEEEIAAL